MGDKAKVLHEADQAYGELREAIDGVHESAARRVWLGSWGLREILIHISGWHQEMIPALARIGRGEAAYPAGSYDDADTWNARFVEAQRDAKLTEILVGLERSHRDFVTAAANLGDEHFATGAAARELFEGCTSLHYREHGEQIRSWREEKSG